MMFSQQPQTIQRLLIKIREIGWGEIENLQIRDGEPLLDSPTNIARDIALDRSYMSKPYRHDEKLKPQVMQLVRQFRKTCDGVIPIIHIKDGLPIRLRVDDKL